MSDVTQILGAIQQGDPKAADELLPLVYQELRRLASFKMANESPGQALQPTALVQRCFGSVLTVDAINRLLAAVARWFFSFFIRFAFVWWPRRWRR